MNRFFKSICLWLGLSGLAWGQTVNNYSIIDTPTNITATRFNNFGFISLDTWPDTFNLYKNDYFASSGDIFGFAGFRFANVTGKTIRPSVAFTNTGFIEAEDVNPPLAIGVSSLTGGGAIGIGGFGVSGTGAGIPSIITIDAANVVNSGTLTVGNEGTLNITGKNVNLSYGKVLAGSIGTNDTSVFDTETAEEYIWVTPGQGSMSTLFTQDEPNTYDLLWGMTNGQPARIANMVTADAVPGLYDVSFPPFFATNRGVSLGEAFAPRVRAQGLSGFAYTYDIPAGQGTNFYYYAVLLDTNFIAQNGDPNMSVTVQFGNNLTEGFSYVPLNPNAQSQQNALGDPNGIPIVVAYSEGITDPISGDRVTNSIYLEDDGGTLGVITPAQNIAYTASYSRPDNFELTFTQPPQLEGMLNPTNTPFELTNIYSASNPSMASQVFMTNSLYEAQVGVNPDSVTGVFPSLTGLEVSANIPNVTNQSGRITINARNLDLHNLKLSGTGLLTINATNVTGLPTVLYYSTANLNLGATTNSLLLTNIVPVIFEQLRGDVELWDGTWVNMQTNSSSTNEVHTHLLYVGQNLSARYTPTVRQFSAKSTNIIVKNDIAIIQNATFITPSLDVVSNLFFTQSADDFTPANAPKLRHLFVEPGALIEADGIFDVGFHLPVQVTSPIGRGYSVLTVTNDGEIFALSPTLEAATIENDGIMVGSGGAIALAAKNLRLGLGTNGDELFASRTVTLSANSIQISNTFLECHGLIMTPVKELTDLVAGTIGTNSPGGISDLVNFCTVSNELVLNRKPTMGDLYGTQIRLVAPEGSPASVTWAGADKGDSPAGFEDNAVIGDLILDRLTNTAIIQFSAVGHKNALYVNHLELADASLSDYTHNVFVDPHLTIYVASANVPIEKLTNISPQFVFAANSVATAQPAVAQSDLALGASPGTSTPLLPVANPPLGIYSGLFAPSSGATSGDFGYVTFTFGKKGSFSGRAQIAGSVVPFSSVLNSRGFGSATAGALSISFTVDSTGHAAGEVIGDGWTAVLNANVASAAPSSYAGRYVLTLPGPGGSAPSADSVAHVSVNNQGVVTVTGKLADGAAFASSTRISPTGQWPFFAYSPSGKDVLSGWLNFGAAPTQLSGSVLWTKPSKAARAYPEGFDNVVPVTGAASK